jgi:hypothetical protein
MSLAIGIRWAVAGPVKLAHTIGSIVLGLLPSIAGCLGIVRFGLERAIVRR